MFKRLADRVSSAVASVAGIPNTQNPNPNPNPNRNPNGRQTQSQSQTATATAVHRLRSLGFSDADARQALQVTNGNVDAAAEWLFGNASGTAGATTATTTTTTTTTTTEDDELQRAISASLEQQAARPQPSQPPPQPPQSAAAKRAGHAALARFQQQGPTNKSTNKSTNKNKNKSTSTSTSTWHGTAKPNPNPNPKQKQNEAKAAPRSDSMPFAATNNNNNNNSSVAIASHPTVKVPKRLSQHDKEDVILRCAQRVAPYPTAVDTLLRSLTQLKQNPSDLKFRTIDTSTAGFQRSLNVPGALDFFKAMGYHHITTNTHISTHININININPNINTNNPTVLELSFVDPATLYLGISALEQIQETSPEYHANKILFKFDKELQQILALADSDMDEALKRSKHMSKVPSEPTMGGGQITVELGSRSPAAAVAAAAAAVATNTNTNTNHATHKISRKFDGDDCLEDILHWMGGHGSVLYDRLVSGEWFLVNRNHRDGVAYNIPDLKTKTLQYMGCWPSGRLAVVPTRPSTSSSHRMPTSSRGLGAAPMDALKL